MQLLLIFLGGGLGSLARYATGLAMGRLLGLSFPYGTLTVNVVGGFLMGLAISYLALRASANTENLRLFLAVGILGGYTTFSAFTADVMALYQRGDTTQAALYTAASLALALLALISGQALGQKIF